MKVYEMRGSLVRYIKGIARSDEEEIAMRVLAEEEKRFRYADLRGYGLKDTEIQELLSRGFLKEKEVDHYTAVHIAFYHRLRYDEAYREKQLAKLKKGRESVDIETKRACARAARAERIFSAERRRNSLLHKVIIPEFGVYMNGRKRVPESGISVGDVEEALERHPQIQELYSWSVYPVLRTDLKSLGIKTTPPSVRLRKTLKKKKEDPEFLEMSRRRGSCGSEERERRYKADPMRAQAAYASISNALREKIRTDTSFGEKTLETLRKNREKGPQAMKERASRKRHELGKIVKQQFGGSIHDIRYPAIVGYLRANMPDFLAAYCKGDPYNRIKRDMHILKEEELA